MHHAQQGGQQTVTDGTGWGNEEEQGAAEGGGASDLDFLARKIFEFECRGGFSHFGAPLMGESAHGSQSLVEKSDLARQCHHEYSEGQKRDPEQDIRNQQGVHHRLAPREIEPLRAI